MPLPASTTLSDPGAIFVAGTAYTDIPAWQATAAHLRHEDPVHRVEIDGWMPFWAVTRYDDVFAIERQPDRFLNTTRSVLMPTTFYDQQESFGMQVKTLVQMDGAEHNAYRSIANDWFKPTNLRRNVEGLVELLASEFVDRLARLAPECDFAREIGLLFPLRVIMTLFGVPEADEPLMLELTQKVFGNEDPEFGGGDRMQALFDAFQRFYPYFETLTADRLATPRSDLATVLANGTVGEEPIGGIERFSYYLIVATAGHDTTSNALNGGIEQLCRHPEQIRYLQSHPDAIDNAVQEIIRHSTPVRHFLRFAAEDTVIGDKRISAGDAVLLSYLSANRDESKFADPDRFDITRNNADELLSFGTGVHFCLGAHLSRLELRLFFRELLRRLDSIELADNPTHVVSNFVGGLKNLPVRFRFAEQASASPAC